MGAFGKAFVTSVFLVLGFFFLLLIGLSAFFSGIEVGLISLDHLKLEQEARKNRFKARILRFTENPEMLFGTTLIGTNISNVAISLLVVIFYEEFSGFELTGIDEDTGSLIIAGIVLVFAEIIPKALFRDYPYTLVANLFPFLWFFYILFRPLSKLVSAINRLMARWFNLPEKSGYELLTREDLFDMLTQNQDEMGLHDHQREMLEEALEFKDLKARNVMLPRTDMIAVDAGWDLDQVIELAKEHGFTRFPVYDQDIDHVIGILIIYDLLIRDPSRNQTAREFMRQALFVPENMEVNDLLKDMQSKRKSMVIVVDSYGGTAGLVTVEDILEEIVGEIEDEYDSDEDEQRDIVQIDENSYLIRGHVEVDQLNDEYDLNLPVSDSYETIAGLVIDSLAKIPARGQIVMVAPFHLEIVQVSASKIMKVKLTKTKDQTGNTRKM